MGLVQLLKDAAHLFGAHPAPAVAIVVGIGVFAYWRPKVLFKLIGAILLLGAIFYVISFAFELTSSGAEQKERLLSRPEERAR